MYELVYYSEADASLTEEGIAEILKKSRKFNSENDITGCLLYHKGEFIQILEGEESIVKDLYHKIGTDQRHHDVILLFEGATKERTFKNWSMAYQKLENVELQKLGEELFAHKILDFAALTKEPANAVQLFWFMAKHLLER